MATKLTKPQYDLMLKSVRNGPVSVGRQNWRVAHNLVAKGYMEQHPHDTTFHNTRVGLEALLYDCKLKDCAQGSMATMLRVEEVEAKLASLRVPA